jgi:hypothetical protein
MYKVLILTIVMLSLLMVGVAVQYAYSAPYLYPPDPKILLVKEMKPGCRSGHIPPACIGAMKSLNRSFLYYDKNGNLKQMLKLIWTYKEIGR